jgi:hypothetical protein
LVSQHIFLTLVIFAAVACRSTETVGGEPQPLPRTQTQPDSTRTAGKTGQSPALDEQKKSILDADSTAGSDKDKCEEGDHHADEQPLPKPQPSAVSTATATATATSTSESSDSSTVVFRIKPGTGDGPWNTPDNPIVAKVGQTLEIHNDDSVQHWLHAEYEDFTTHALSGIDPGKSMSVKINNDRSDKVRDHLTGGAIYFKISK